MKNEKRALPAEKTVRSNGVACLVSSWRVSSSGSLSSLALEMRCGVRRSGAGLGLLGQAGLMRSRSQLVSPFLFWPCSSPSPCSRRWSRGNPGPGASPGLWVPSSVSSFLNFSLAPSRKRGPSAEADMAVQAAQRPPGATRPSGRSASQPPSSESPWRRGSSTHTTGSSLPAPQRTVGAPPPEAAFERVATLCHWGV